MIVAPLQRLTEAVWRSVHLAMFGERQGDVEYFTPFIRVEKGVVRTRDLRDYMSDLNSGMKLTPQIIFRDTDEWRLLVDTLAEAGAERIDMNLGCPFVPQVRKGRGAGMLCRREMLARIADAMTSYAGTLKFSIKMRLGIDSPQDSLDLVDIINGMPLRHVTIHPRTAEQQYKGDLLLAEMTDLTSRLRHPMIFNGEISTPSDIATFTSTFAGVMVGRGLLARPSLFAEFRSGRELSSKEQEDTFLDLMKGIQALLGQSLCGTAQLRDKLKPYWDYTPASLNRKTVKQGKKHGFLPMLIINE